LSGTDPKMSCVTNNAGHVCVQGLCGCATNMECPRGIAPFCTGNVCGCGAPNIYCAMGMQLCTTFDPNGQCLTAPLQPCMVNPECASMTPNSCTFGQCAPMGPGQPCLTNMDCMSGTCMPMGCL
jgi:hypothetical protein